MPRLIDVLASEVVGHSINLMRFDATMRKQVLGIMEDLQTDLISKITQADPTAAKTTSLKLQRARQLLADTTTTIDNYYNKTVSKVQRSLFGVAQVESNFSRKSINTLVGADLMSVTLDPNKLKKLADQALVLGAPASEWWGRQASDLKKKYADQIRMGVASGETLSQLTQRIRGNYTGRYIEVEDSKGRKKRVPEFSGGVLSTSTRNAEALIRTSVQSVANETRLASYKANTDVIKGVQALVTLDNRTTPMCRGRSGMSWNILTGEPLDAKTNIHFPGPPPWHYQCRTTLIPVLKSWAELAGPKSKVPKATLDQMEAALPRKMQSSMDGQVAGDLTYEDWIRTKDVPFQKEVLGPGRWKLWTENKIGFADMIDQSGNPLTLLELEAKVNSVVTPAFTDFVDQVIYHGTSQAASIAITKNGLDAGTAGAQGEAAYVTMSRAVAEEYGDTILEGRVSGRFRTFNTNEDMVNDPAIRKLIEDILLEEGQTSKYITKLRNDPKLYFDVAVDIIGESPTIVNTAFSKYDGIYLKNVDYISAFNPKKTLTGLKLSTIDTPKVFERGSEAAYRALEELGVDDARDYYNDAARFKANVAEFENMTGRPLAEYLETFKQVGVKFKTPMVRSYIGDDFAEIGLATKEPYVEISRKFLKEGSKLQVDHSIFELDDTLHGQGISKRFLRESFKFYKNAGVDRVDVYASMGNGAYTWARFGFLPTKPEWKKILHVLQRIDGDAEYKAFVSALDPEDTKGLWDAADSKWGRDVLPGLSWEGKFNMKDPAQIERFNAYVGETL